MQVTVLRETRRCPACKEDLPRESYPPSRWIHGGRCRPCGNDYDTQRRRARGVKPQGPPSTPERKAQQLREWHEKNPRAKKAHALMRSYGMTLEEYDALFARQQGLCSTCHKPETRKNPWGDGVCDLHVDHDHTTGQVRGLLCARCNLALGYAQENPEILRSLANYIEEWS